MGDGAGRECPRTRLLNGVAARRAARKHFRRLEQCQAGAEVKATARGARSPGQRDPPPTAYRLVNNQRQLMSERSAAKPWDELLRRFVALRGRSLRARPPARQPQHRRSDIVGRVRGRDGVHRRGGRRGGGRRPVPRVGPLWRAARQDEACIEKVTVMRRDGDEVVSLINAPRPDRAPANADMTWPELPHVRVGQAGWSSASRPARPTWPRSEPLLSLPGGLLAAAGRGHRGRRQPRGGADCRRDSRQAVAQNCTALMALTSIRTSDTYTSRT
jgi:hypothetical protein